MDRHQADAATTSALEGKPELSVARVEWVQHQSMAIGESLKMPLAVRNFALGQRGRSDARPTPTPYVGPLVLYGTQRVARFN